METFDYWQRLQAFIQLFAHLFENLVSKSGTMLKMDYLDTVVNFEQNL